MIALKRPHLALCSSKFGSLRRMFSENQKIDLQSALHPKARCIAVDSNGLIAVDKDSGILSHPNCSLDMRNSFIKAPYNLSKECYMLPVVGSCTGGSKPVWLLNRLDSATSGIILLCSNQELAKIIKKQFATRKVRKKYTAVVFGHENENVLLRRAISSQEPLEWTDDLLSVQYEKSQGKSKIVRSTVLPSPRKGGHSFSYSGSAPLIKSTPDINSYRRSSNNPSKLAVTSATISKCINNDMTPPGHTTMTPPGHTTMTPPGYTITPPGHTITHPDRSGLYLVELEPRTGFTHQLRIQCAVRGLPIVGDKIYGDFQANKEFSRSFLSKVVDTVPVTIPRTLMHQQQGRLSVVVERTDSNLSLVETTDSNAVRSAVQVVTSPADRKRLFLHSTSVELTYTLGGKDCRFSASSPLPYEFQLLTNHGGTKG